jgi:hypothetical protein
MENGILAGIGLILGGLFLAAVSILIACTYCCAVAWDWVCKAASKMWLHLTRQS